MRRVANPHNTEAGARQSLLVKWSWHNEPNVKRVLEYFPLKLHYATFGNEASCSVRLKINPHWELNSDTISKPIYLSMIKTHQIKMQGSILHCFPMHKVCNGPRKPQRNMYSTVPGAQLHWCVCATFITPSPDSVWTPVNQQLESTNDKLSLWLFAWTLCAPLVTDPAVCRYCFLFLFL